KLLMTEKGRANQMNHGAKEAKYKYILFLHADTLLNPSSLDSLIVEIESKNVLWGWFPIRLNNSRLIYRIIELFANLRARVTGTPLGDHAIFVRKDIFEKVGGYPDIPIMEDLELVNKIKNIKKGMRVKSPVITSVRRFENSGILRTFLKMWTLRILYFLGISTQTLVRYYGDIR
ncbi:MAG: TIGR04283 family arsenosugar biosynthesis glycosyltransferase, partial [Thermodesulfobacteriota bacterium]